MADTSRVQGPAIGLIVSAALGILVQLASVVANLTGMGAGMMDGGDQAYTAAMSGAAGIVMSLVGIGVGGFIIFGCLKMKSMESYGLAMAATILSMIPCISPCCLLGLPIGIWALVVLLNDEVKAGFQQ